MNTISPLAKTTVQNLAKTYDALLIDAFGVLVSSAGPLPGASEFLAFLHRVDKPYLVVTNDSSRTAKSCASWYNSLGLDIDAARVVTSGSLLSEYFADNNLVGSHCVALGPPDSIRSVQDAGGILVEPGDDSASVVVVGDDSGFPFLETTEIVLSQIFRRLDAGKTMHLILPNPDLIYPKGPGEYGFTSGSVALLLEEAMRLRYPHRTELGFVRLGKPFAPIYAIATRRLGTRNVVMIGDQLRTDILGANRFGIASALVSTGISRFDPEALHGENRPTWILESLT